MSEISQNKLIITIVSQNRESGRKSRHMAKITLISDFLSCCNYEVGRVWPTLFQACTLSYSTQLYGLSSLSFFSLSASLEEIF